LYLMIGRPCGYCGEPMDSPSRDHAMVPKHKGGQLVAGNRVVCCEPCNRDKAARSLVRWREVLAAANDRRLPYVDAAIALLAEHEARRRRRLTQPVPSAAQG
jgi:5-methylcytosine-specific restriction endonuclease McrA